MIMISAKNGNGSPPHRFWEERGVDTASCPVIQVHKIPPRHLSNFSPLQDLDPSPWLGWAFQWWFWKQIPVEPRQRCLTGLLLYCHKRILKWMSLKIGRWNGFFLIDGPSSYRMIMPGQFSSLWWVWTQSCISWADWGNVIIWDIYGHGVGV